MKNIKQFFITLSTILISLAIVAVFISCEGSQLGGSDDTTTSSLSKTLTTGFPSDFSVPDDEVHGGKVRGLGGDKSKNQASHQSTIADSGKNPVVILHGNGGSADSEEWGIEGIYTKLIAMGYKKEHLWAPSYLGYEGTDSNHGLMYADYPNLNSNNISDITAFITNVLDYTGAEKVDIIGHSSGVTLARLYVIGYSNDHNNKSAGSAYNIMGTCYPNSSMHFDYDTNNKLDVVGTIILIAGDNYGFDSADTSLCKCEFAEPSHSDGYQHRKLNEVWEANATEIKSKIKTIAVIAEGDWVDINGDKQYSWMGYTSALEWADDNIVRSMPSSSAMTAMWPNCTSSSSSDAIAWHKCVTHEQATFDTYKGYLNVVKGGPVITINPNGGVVVAGTEVTISISDSTPASYTINGGSAQNFTNSTTITINTATELVVTAGSSTKSASFAIDNQTPITKFYVDGNEVSGDMEVAEGTVLTIKSTHPVVGDADTITYTVNGSTQTASGGTVTVTLNAASTVSAYGTNSNGDGVTCGPCSFTIKPPCQEFSATNDEHVSAGRAYTETSAGWWWFPGTTTYYATGSQDNLGTSGSTTTTVSSMDGSSWSSGSCQGGDGDGDGDCTHCNSYSCCVDFGCAGYSYVNGGMKCYVMSGYTMAPCDCWQ